MYVINPAVLRATLLILDVLWHNVEIMIDLYTLKVYQMVSTLFIKLIENPPFHR